MEDIKIAFLQIACGFTRGPERSLDTEALSPVDTARSKELIKAVEFYTQEEYCPWTDNFQVWTSGMVSFNPNDESNTLARLNAHVLANEINFSTGPWRQVPGLNAFSESLEACRLAKQENIDLLLVITSDFYLKGYRRMWTAAAKRYGIKLEIVEVKHESGLVAAEVIDFYQSAKVQILSRLAASSEIGHMIARYVADLKTKCRAENGFKLDGYSMIG